MQKLCQLANYRLLSLVLLLVFTALMTLFIYPKTDYVTTKFRAKHLQTPSRHPISNETTTGPTAPHPSPVVPCPTLATKTCPICPPTPTVPAKQTCPAPKPCPSQAPCRTDSAGGNGVTPGGRGSSIQAIQVEPDDSLQEIESSNLHLIEALQRERLHTLKKACAAWKTAYKWHSDTPDPKSMFSRRYNFSVCDIFKCGYTSWMEAILVMDGVFTLEEYKQGKAQGERPNKLIGIQRMGTKRSRQEMQALWDSVPYKIITVRNPFNRLVSAYNNKMRPEGKGFNYKYAPMSKKINKKVKHLRTNPLDRNRTDDGLATFEDFINFVLIDKTPDAHWMGFDQKCNPCNVKYDFMMKFETLAEDANFLERKINLTEEHTQAFFPHRTFKTNSDLTQTFYESLPSSMVEKLFRKFEIDFDLFGYEKPTWMANRENSKTV